MPRMAGIPMRHRNDRRLDHYLTAWTSRSFPIQPGDGFEAADVFSGERHFVAEMQVIHQQDIFDPVVNRRGAAGGPCCAGGSLLDRNRTSKLVDISHNAL